VKTMKLKDVITYYLLKTIKNVGISMPLLFRRMTDIMSKEIHKIEKMLQIEPLSTTDLNNLVHELVNLFVKEKLAREIDVKISSNEILIDVYDCNYLYMSEEEINEERKCPICLIALTASIAQTLIKDIEFNFVEYNIDPRNRKCEIRVSFIKP